MAITGNPGTAQQFSAQGDERTGRCYVISMGVLGFGVAADTIVVTDSHDRLIMEFEAEGPNVYEYAEIEKWVDGIKIATLDSGILQVMYG